VSLESSDFLRVFGLTASALSKKRHYYQRPVPEIHSTSTPTRLRNFGIAIAAIALAILMFFGVSQRAHQVSLATLAARAMPVDVALSNGRPTFLEFYADWCSSCRAMARDIDQLESSFANQVNFVMLNVDNPKWMAELLQYQVDGIPHFVFFDANGHPLANAIGEQPKTILTQNLTALAAGESLPYTTTALGATSTLESGSASSSSGAADPRSHGGMPQA
jgi:thiol-disulfide isomerase/thioredoxin